MRGIVEVKLDSGGRACCGRIGLLLGYLGTVPADTSTYNLLAKFGVGCSSVETTSIQLHSSLSLSLFMLLHSRLQQTV